MKNITWYRPVTLLLAILSAVVIPLVPPATPVYAWQTHTWDTKAQFDAGALSNVDTSSSPNDVVLAANLNRGEGSDGPLTVTDAVYFTDGVRTPVSSTSYINSSYIFVGSTAGFAVGQEVLIIQMTGAGAGTWETANLGGTGVNTLIFTGMLRNAYYADANSAAQIIKVPHWTNVTVGDGGILMCHPWLQSSQTGGVIFFRATGTVTVSQGGLIEASGLGFPGGAGGNQGAANGGQGGAHGDFNQGDGYDGEVGGGGGKGGDPGFCLMHGWGGGDGGNQGYGGAAGQPGTAGAGPAGGASDHGGTNGSTASLNLMQAGSGGGGGSSGRQGYGGGGGGGGGLNACVWPKFGRDGTGGSAGGTPGNGRQGGLGAGIVAIHANQIVLSQANQIKAQGQTTTVADNGGNGGNGGTGGCGENGCGQSVNGQWQSFGAGGGGGGGNGGTGGGGGNGGGGGAGGTIWLAASNINLATNGASALGATGGAAGQGGSGGPGGAGGCGGSGDDGCNGKNGTNGASGPAGQAGSTGGGGGAGAIRLDYNTLSGSANPAPGYTSGLYSTSGTIASDVWDTGVSAQPWTMLSWQETLHSATDITFAVRASDTLFTKDNNAIPWIAVGGASPVKSGLPSGRYMQWRATLSTSSNFYSPVLHSVLAAASTSPDVSTNAATFVTNNGAVIHGTLNSIGLSSTSVNVNFFWGTTQGGPYPNPTTWQPMTAPGTFLQGLPGLTAATTYYFKARADDGVNPPVFGEELSFRTSSAHPTVTTISSGSVTSGSAILNGNLTSRGTASTVNVAFQWGTTQGGPYPNSTIAQAMTSTGAFQASLSGLGANTAYYFRASADGGTNGAGYGSEMSFITSRLAPVVATGNAAPIGSTSATLNGSLSNPGSAATVNVSLQWGTTQGGPYPNSTPVQSMTAAGPFSASLSGLSAKTTYYFIAKADGGISGASYGAEQSFTTTIIQPAVFTNGATGITSNSAILNGNLTSLGTAATVNVVFYYGLHPGEFNHTASTTLSSPGSFQASLTDLAPDTTYYFRASAQGDGNSVDGAELTFHTAKVPPAVTTNGPGSVTANSAIVNGALTQLGTASAVNVSFQWGTTSGMYSVETTPQSMSSAGNFQAPLGGLLPGTTYYYRAKANGGINGIAYGDEHSFTTNGLPPGVTSNNASNLTTNSATLNGNLDTLGTAATVNVSFQWGTTQGGPYPNITTPQPKSAAGAFLANLSGLASNTTYYYRARADGGIYGAGYGSEKSFSTPAFPPYVVTGPASGITANAATLNGDLYFMGSSGTVNVSFLYGTTHGGPYPNTTAQQSMSATGTFLANLSGLNPNTTYYYRARADGQLGDLSYGDEYRFTTSAIPPTVITNDAGNIAALSATLNGSLSALGTATSNNVSFQYGTTAGGPYTGSTTPQAMTATGAFQAGISGLAGNTTYYFRARADGGNYGASYGLEKSFTTSMVPPAVTTENATAVSAGSATLSGNLDSLGTAGNVNVSFNWGTSHGGPYPNTTPAQALSSTGPFQANISGLTALTTYYFRAAADGGVHGACQGAECSFTTGAIPPSVSTAGATAVTASSATLNGQLHSIGTAASANVSFQYGTSPGVYSNQTTPQSMGTAGAFNAGLTGLTDHTCYYYRAVASGGQHGTSYGVEYAFTTSALPPSITTGTATDWTTNTAFLNGSLTALGTGTLDTVSFIYGTSPGGPYNNSTLPQAMTSTGAFRTAITGLSPFTTYYFKALANGGIYGTSYGAEMNFTTNRLSPLMDTGNAVDVMTNAAILNGNLYLPGSATTVNASFEYATTQGGPYTSSTPAQAMTAPGAYQSQLSGLTPNTTYYYRAKGDGGASGTGYGIEHAFTTGKHPPLVATNGATVMSASSAILNGDLIVPGTASAVNVSFMYGTNHGGPYPNVTPAQGMTSAGAFQSSLTGLSAHTAYYFRAKADGGIYGGGYGSEMSFITSAIPPAVTTGGANNLTGSTATLNGGLQSLGSSASVNVSFQWGTAHGVYTNQTTAKVMTAPGGFSADISGLNPNITYYYRTKAVGDNTAFGEEKSFNARTTASVSTYLGIVTFAVNTGSISDLAWIQTNNLPCGAPGYNFPYGMFSYSVTGLTPGQTVIVSITLPNPPPAGVKYFKCQNANVIDCSPFMARPNLNTLTLTLTDGGPGDSDGIPNGTIYDPGGPAFPINTSPTSDQSSLPATPQGPRPLPNITVKSAALSDARVTPGTPITVTAIVSNAGTAKGSSLIKVYVNGQEETVQGVNIESGKSRELTFILSRDGPGTYNVHVNNIPAGNFTVDQVIDPNIILVISLALIILSLVLGFIYIWRRSEYYY